MNIEKFNPTLYENFLFKCSTEQANIIEQCCKKHKIEVKGKRILWSNYVYVYHRCDGLELHNKPECTFVGLHFDDFDWREYEKPKGRNISIRMDKNNKTFEFTFYTSDGSDMNKSEKEYVTKNAKEILESFKLNFNIGFLEKIYEDSDSITLKNNLNEIESEK